MPCKYGEHVISCGHGGFTLGARAVKHHHAWEAYWHMGYIIGRQCTDVDCRFIQHMSRKWCQTQMKLVESK